MASESNIQKVRVSIDGVEAEIERDTESNKIRDIEIYVGNVRICRSSTITTIGDLYEFEKSLIALVRHYGVSNLIELSNKIREEIEKKVGGSVEKIEVLTNLRSYSYSDKGFPVEVRIYSYYKGHRVDITEKEIILSYPLKTSELDLITKYTRPDSISLDF